jgi:pyruvate ferredoxin oxidoreductase delta subunit
VSEKKLPGWRDVPIGGMLLTPGSSAEYETGSWRTYRPVLAASCTSCLLCWANCPEMAVELSEAAKVTGFDLRYCKGCGICAEVCPPKVKAITMLLEAEARK